MKKIKANPNLQDAFKIIFDSGTFEITQDWLIRYVQKIRTYDNSDWFYALTKRLKAYHLLVEYISQVYHNSKENTSQLISSPTKTPINPHDFLNFLGKPEHENINFIIMKIVSIYVSHEVIQESDKDEFVISLCEETSPLNMIMQKESSTDMSPQKQLQPEKHKYNPKLTFLVINERISSMIKIILLLAIIWY